MIQTIFEETGGTYRPCGDYLLPDLVLPPKESTHSDIGVWGRRHLDYLRQYKQVLLNSLMTEGKLHAYLADIDRRATEMHLRAVTNTCRKRGRDRAAQSRKSNAVGTENERHRQYRDRDGGRRNHLCVTSPYEKFGARKAIAISSAPRLCYDESVSIYLTKH